MTSTSVSNSELAALIAGLGGGQPAAAVPAQPPAAEPRCAVTELLASQCAHCRPAPPAEQSDAGLGPWFTSTYRGGCSGCGISFDEFTEIRADGEGGWLARCCGHAAETNHVDPLDGLIAPAATAATEKRGGPVEAYDNPSTGDAPAAQMPAGYVPFEKCTCPGDDDGIGHSHGCKHWPNQMPAAQAPAAISRPVGPPPSTVAEMREVLANLDASRPRSRQTALGPSELGTPCQRQIAMKLAGVPRRPEDKRPPWAPMQGTAMHTLMEEALRFHNAQLGRDRWVVEEQLTIHPGIGGDDPGIHGHGDAFDTDHGCVVDWKYVGVTTLRDVKRKTIPNEQLVKPEYRIQAHLYGLGHERAGRDVRHVRLVFLARSHDYSDSAEWTEPYQPEIAFDAIHRYYATLDLLTALDVANNPGLWPAVPATPGKACDWCPFRRVGGTADATGCPGNTDQQVNKQLHGLIA